MDGSIYRLGVALHDLQNPAKILGVGDSWILQPEDPWEVTGYVHNVVFTCGAVAGAGWNREDLLGRRGYGDVRGRSEHLGSCDAVPGTRETREVTIYQGSNCEIVDRDSASRTSCVIVDTAAYALTR